MANVKTLEDALSFLETVQICTIFSDQVKGIASLWEVVDLPEKGGGQTKWGAKMEAVWAWKNELPAKFPDRVFYGKLPGGHATLMTLSYLREIHYPAAKRPLAKCSELARQVYEIIRTNPGPTGGIRKQVIAQFGCSKSRFDTALKQLQISLNIARVCDPSPTCDSWVPFSEMYADFAEEQL